MNRKGMSWIGAVFVLVIGGLVFFFLLQMQTLFRQTQSHSLKQMQGIGAPAHAACDEASGVCPLAPEDARAPLP